jgi:hypothetical protein
MTTTPKVLIPPKLAEAAETTQYTSDNCKTAIDKLTATNITGANATLTVHLVPSGGAAGASNAFSKVIAPGATWTFPEIVGHVLESGDVISTIAGTASALSIRSSGRQFT